MKGVAYEESPAVAAAAAPVVHAAEQRAAGKSWRTGAPDESRAQKKKKKVVLVDAIDLMREAETIQVCEAGFCCVMNQDMTIYI